MTHSNSPESDNAATVQQQRAPSTQSLNRQGVLKSGPLRILSSSEPNSSDELSEYSLSTWVGGAESPHMPGSRWRAQFVPIVLDPNTACVRLDGIRIEGENKWANRLRHTSPHQLCLLQSLPNIPDQAASDSESE